MFFQKSRGGAIPPVSEGFWNATYPFIASEASPLWFLLGLLFLFWFGRDVYSGMGRRHFWRLIVWSSVGARGSARAAEGLAGVVTAAGELGRITGN